jgi:hypothetical protein
MSARTAFHPDQPSTRRARRGVPAHRAPGPPASAWRPATAADEPPDLDPAGRPFRVASRDRLIPRQRGEQRLPPRVSFEVLLALAIVVLCMCGALAVGAAFNLEV